VKDAVEQRGVQHHVVILEQEGPLSGSFECHCTAGDWHLLTPWGRDHAAERAAAHLREKGRAIPRPTDLVAHSRTQPNSRGVLQGHRFGEFEDKPPLAGR
jgi:hypothetical protein